MSVPLSCSEACVCRSCMLQGDSMESLFEASIMDKIVFCTGLQFADSDGLPAHICHHCSILLDSAYRFKTTFLNSDAVLRKTAAIILEKELDSLDSDRDADLTFDDKCGVDKKPDDDGPNRGLTKIQTENRELNLDFKDVVKVSELKRGMEKNIEKTKVQIKIEDCSNLDRDDNWIFEDKCGVKEKLDEDGRKNPVIIPKETDFVMNLFKFIQNEFKEIKQNKRERKNIKKGKLYVNVEASSNKVAHWKFDNKCGVKKNIYNDGRKRPQLMQKETDFSMNFDVENEVNVPEQKKGVRINIKKENVDVEIEYSSNSDPDADWTFDDKCGVQKDLCVDGRKKSRSIENKTDFVINLRGQNVFKALEQTKTVRDNIENGKDDVEIIDSSKAVATKPRVKRVARTKKQIRRKLWCGTCKVAFPDRKTEKEHKIANHNLTFLCEHCGKYLESRASSYYHIQSHKQSAFPCNLCSYTTGYKFDFEKHMRTHSDWKMYQCEFCPAAFRTRSNLNKHVQCVHERRRNYACPLCPHEFFKKAQLVQHLYMHNNIKRYTCSECGTALSCRTNYTKHMMRVHGIRLEKRRPGPGPARHDLGTRLTANTEAALPTMILGNENSPVAYGGDSAIGPIGTSAVPAKSVALS